MTPAIPFSWASNRPTNIYVCVYVCMYVCMCLYSEWLDHLEGALESRVDSWSYYQLDHDQFSETSCIATICPLNGCSRIPRFQAFGVIAWTGQFLGVGCLCLSHQATTNRKLEARQKLKGASGLTGSEKFWGLRFGGSLRGSLRGPLRGLLVLENQSQNAPLTCLPAPSQSAIVLSELRALSPLIVSPFETPTHEASLSQITKFARRAWLSWISSVQKA